VIRSSKTAFKRGVLIRKIDRKKIGPYLIEVERRRELGANGAISQVVRTLKNGRTEESWHIVIKAGKIIHQHLLK